MAIITSSTHDAAARRSTIRELADISTNKMSDDDLDRRIEHWDSVSRTYYRIAPDATISGTEDYAEPLVVTSNLMTTAAIRMGIGGNDNMSIGKEQLKMAKDTVQAYFGRTAEQSTISVAVTQGIDAGAYTDYEGDVHHDGYDPYVGRRQGVGTFT